MNILITGAGGASGICAITALKKSTHHKILACDCDRFSAGLHLAHKNFIVPMAKNEEKFLAKIIDKVKEYHIEVIFPNVDEELLVFAKNKSKIPCHVIISPFPTIDICNNKYKLMSEMKDVVPTPSMGDVSPPLFIKPRIGRGSRNVFKVKNKDEMNVLLKYLNFQDIKCQELLIQEYLPGKEYTVDTVFDSKGNVVVAVPRERIRTSGGASFIGRTEKNHHLIELVGKISRELAFFGPVNMQFKKDKSGHPKLIEINPRCSGGMAITYSSGINPPKLTLDLLNGKEIAKEDLQWTEKTIFRHMVEINSGER